MNIVGIVCEYNPFHLGHEFHIQKSRELVGEDSVLVCVMSGDFVQRGEAALYSKFARAEAACFSGADLVLELPVPWAIASAEGFARGAVALLGALGATHLSFGSEAGEVGPLSELAQALLKPDISGEIKALMAANAAQPYAAARQQVLEAKLGAFGGLVSAPNNTLAVEYLKAIYSLKLDTQPMTVKRLGAGHDAVSDGPGLRSASQIRECISRGEDVGAFLPPSAAQIYARERTEGRELADRRLLEAAMLSRLRMFSEDYFNSLPDAGHGLGSRIYRAVREETGLEAIYMAAKTKRYALSRIRRVCLCACLGITAGMSSGLPPYARVLAANSRGRELLRRQAKDCAVPIITKPAAVRELSKEAEAVFTLGADAHDLYVLGYGEASQRTGGQDWRTGPCIVG